MFKYVAYTPAQDEFTRYEFIDLDDRATVHKFSVPFVSVEYDDEQAFTDLMAHQPPQISAVEITQAEFAVEVGQSAQVLRVRKRSEELLDGIVLPLSEEYPDVEQKTWPFQLEEARAYQASGNEADAPMLTIMSAAESDTVANFAAAVIAKNDAYRQWEPRSRRNVRS